MSNVQNQQETFISSKKAQNFLTQPNAPQQGKIVKPLIQYTQIKNLLEPPPCRSTVTRKFPVYFGGVYVNIFTPLGFVSSTSCSYNSTL